MALVSHKTEDIWTKFLDLLKDHFEILLNIPFMVDICIYDIDDVPYNAIKTVFLEAMKLMGVDRFFVISNDPFFLNRVSIHRASFYVIRNKCTLNFF